MLKSKLSHTKFKDTRKFSRFETVLLNSDELSDNLKTDFSNYTWTVRNSQNFKNFGHQIIWNTSVDIIGPLFFSFIVWVLNCAKSDGVNRLYFVARDGYIFYKIAETIIHKFDDYDIELKYIYGSRQAWYFPAIEALTDFELNWIIRPDLTFTSIEKIFARIDAVPETYHHTLMKFGFYSKDWKKNLSKLERKRLRNCLLSQEIQKDILKKTEIAYNDTEGYLLQEGFKDSTCYAIVDIGWSGRSQYSLSKILDNAGFRPPQGIKGYYLGLYQNYTMYKNDCPKAYLFNGRLSMQQAKIINIMLYEVFSATSDPRTVRYKKDSNNRYHPVFEEETNQLRTQWGIQVQHKGILSVISYFLYNTTFEELKKTDFRNTLIRMLVMFMDNPGKSEAEIYGKYPVNAEAMGNDERELAPIVTIRTLIYKIIKKKRPISFWPVASLSRSNLNALKKLWQAISILIWLWKTKKMM